MVISFDLIVKDLTQVWEGDKWHRTDFQILLLSSILLVARLGAAPQFLEQTKVGLWLQEEQNPTGVTIPFFLWGHLRSLGWVCPQKDSAVLKRTEQEGLYPSQGPGFLISCGWQYLGHTQPGPVALPSDLFIPISHPHSNPIWCCLCLFLF